MYICAASICFPLLITLGTVFIKNREQCPLRECQIVSMVFDHEGGELSVKEHAVKVIIPPGAIDEGFVVQIEVAASLFGSYKTPKGYHTISPYGWLGASYIFKKKLQVEIEHDVHVTKKTNLSELCVLTTHGENKWEMHEDTCEYQYELNNPICTLFVSQFCSKCLAEKGEAKIPKRIIMYFYLPKDYKSAHEFIAEVTFCYALRFCMKVCSCPCS